MATLTDKIDDLINFIQSNDEVEEKISYLTTAPLPKPSSSDIDTSKIKIVVLGCGLVVPPLIEVE